MSPSLKLTNAGQGHILAELDQIQTMLVELHQMVEEKIPYEGHQTVFSAAVDSIDSLRTLLKIEWQMISKEWVEEDKRSYPLPF